MTVHNHSITGTTHAAENAAFTLVQEKERKKQRKELAKLRSALVLLDDELEKAKSEKAGASEKGSNKIVELEQPGASEESFQNVMAELAYVLQMLQVKITQASNNKANLDNKIARAMISESQQILNQTRKEIAKQEKAEKSQKVWNDVVKALEVVLYVATMIVAVCTLNPVTAAIILSLSTALLLGNLTGGTKAITDFLAKAIAGGNQEDGKPDHTSNLIAAVIVTAVIALICLAVGSIGSAADAGAVASEEAAEGASNSGLAAKTFMLGLGQAASETGLNQDIALTLATNKKGKVNQTEEEIIEIILSVITSVIALAGTTGLMQGGSGAASDDGIEGASKLAKALGKAKGFIQSPKGITGLNWVNAIGQVASGGASIAEGGTVIQQGILEEALAALRAQMMLMGVAEDMSSTQIRSDQQHEKNALKSQRTGDVSMSKLMAGEAAFANVFTAYSPV